MSDLINFNDNVNSAIRAYGGFNVAGVAKIQALNGSYSYSASFVSCDKNAELPDLQVLARRFQAMSVAGYAYSKSELLTFITTSSVPKPYWRIQVKYVKC